MNINYKEYFFWDNDPFWMERKRIYIEQDYKRSDFASVELWGASRDGITEGGMLRYKTKRSEEKFDELDYLPGNASLPVVTDRLKHLLEAFCPATELGFHPCEVSFADGVGKFWNVCPTNAKACIDDLRTKAEWWPLTAASSERDLQYAEGIIFKEGCLRGEILRLAEKKSSILVSAEFRKVLTDNNVQGSTFIDTAKMVVGVRPANWG